MKHVSILVASIVIATLSLSSCDSFDNSDTHALDMDHAPQYEIAIVEGSNAASDMSDIDGDDRGLTLDEEDLFTESVAHASVISVYITNLYPSVQTIGSTFGWLANASTSYHDDCTWTWQIRYGGDGAWAHSWEDFIGHDFPSLSRVVDEPGDHSVNVTVNCPDGSGYASTTFDATGSYGGGGAPGSPSGGQPISSIDTGGVSTKGWTEVDHDAVWSCLLDPNTKWNWSTGQCEPN